VKIKGQVSHQMPQVFAFPLESSGLGTKRRRRRDPALGPGSGHRWSCSVTAGNPRCCHVDRKFDDRC